MNFVSRLIRMLPSLSAPVAKDWDAAERALGLVLPTDYKQLIDTCGGGYIDEYLYLLEPNCVNDSYDLVISYEERVEAYREIWEVERKPAELENENQIVPWATTDNGEWIFWLVSPEQNPDLWTIVINEARGECWEHWKMNCTEFLARSLSREIKSEILWSRFPLGNHSFEHF